MYVRYDSYLAKRISLKVAPIFLRENQLHCLAFIYNSYNDIFFLLFPSKDVEVKSRIPLWRQFWRTESAYGLGQRLITRILLLVAQLRRPDSICDLSNNLLY